MLNGRAGEATSQHWTLFCPGLGIKSFIDLLHKALGSLLLRRPCYQCLWTEGGSLEVGGDMGVTSDPSLTLVPQTREKTGQSQHETGRLLFLKADPEKKPGPLEHDCGVHLCMRLGFPSITCPVILSCIQKTTTWSPHSHLDRHCH